MIIAGINSLNRSFIKGLHPTKNSRKIAWREYCTRLQGISVIFRLFGNFEQYTTEIKKHFSSQILEYVFISFSLLENDVNSL